MSSPPPKESNAEPVLTTHKLTKRFGDRIAINEVELSVPRATAFGFLGPNGAGKTTLIRTVLGLTRATGGTVRLLGHSMPREKSEALRRVGAIVEEPRFHPHLTGRENLRIVAAAREPEAEERIAAALERVRLSARADERVATYSMGMRQRLGVARCLIADPLFLILDEPMNGLDPAGIQEFREMVAALIEEGRTVFLSSHLLDEVEKTCHLVAIIDQGRILMQGRAEDIGASGRPQLRIRCDEPAAAADLLSQHPGVENLTRTENVLILTLRTDAGSETDSLIAEINRRLVEAGHSVYAIEPERVSLEARFLEMTSRLEEAT